MTESDFLAQIEKELEAKRHELSLLLDAVEAYVELRSYCIEAAQKHRGRFISVEDVFDTDDEERRARLQAISRRIDAWER